LHYVPLFLIVISKLSYVLMSLTANVACSRLIMSHSALCKVCS